jgi:hypothetical protein
MNLTPVSYSPVGCCTAFQLYVARFAHARGYNYQTVNSYFAYYRLTATLAFMPFIIRPADTKNGIYNFNLLINKWKYEVSETGSGKFGYIDP